MKTFRSLRFYSPDEGGDSGGGTAVVDAPPADTSPAQKFHQSMADAGHPPPPGIKKSDMPVEKAPKAPVEKAPDDGKTDEKAPKEKAPKKATKTALDVVAETTIKTDDKAPESTDFLKDLPEALPDDKSAKNTHWTKARGAIDHLGKTVGERDKVIADLTKQLAATRDVPPDVVKERDALKAQLDEYKNALVEVNIELEPSYREKYVKGRATKVDKAAIKLTNFGGNGDALKDALSMREGKARTIAINEALTDVDPVNQARIMSLVTEVENLDDEASDVRANSQTEWEKRKQAMAGEAETKKQQTEANKKAIFEAVGQGLRDAIWPMRKVGADVEGATEWNADADKIPEEAWALSQPGVAPEEYAKAAYYYAAGPRLQKMLVDAYQTIKTLNGLVKQSDDAAPGFRGGGEQGKTEPLTPTQKFHAEMAKSRGE